MTDIPQYDLELCGCTPEPLMAYLKALGILRLVTDQKDPDARGWWSKDVFWLRSPTLFAEASTEVEKRNALGRFCLEDYRPTPIVAPWAGGSGFFKKDNKKAVEVLCGSNGPRCTAYANVIRCVRHIIQDEQIGQKPEVEEKARLIRRYRRELPDEVVHWMDAAMVLDHEGQRFAPLLGTGGNDGRLDFTQNFMQRIVLLGLHKTGAPSRQTREWLDSALFALPARLRISSVGQFSPGRVGGPNATQGMEGLSTDNPWDFVLMLEGAIVLAGAAVRRYGPGGSARAAFPFTVRAVAAGFDSPAYNDVDDSRGELWFPLWARLMSGGEMAQLFGEGRAETSGRPARDGVNFARAVVGLGVDRGIASFNRFGILMRSGKAFLATPIGRFPVTERSNIELLHDVDPWLERFRRSVGDENAPPRFGSALRRIDSAIFEFCKYGGVPLFQNVLIALGAAEREMANANRFRDSAKLQPISRLSPAWIAAADDASPEFALARSLTFVHDPQQKIGPLRTNVERVDRQKRFRGWAEENRSVVWNSADLPTNMANVLQRRITDGDRAGCTRLPLDSRITVPLQVVAAFVSGDLDYERIEQLIWGLMLVDPDRYHVQTTIRVPSATKSAMLPREYALLKPLFLSRRLAADHQGDVFRWRLARRGESGVSIRPEPRILPLLRAGRIGEACCLAAQRLRESGLAPMPGPLPNGIMGDDIWRERTINYRLAQRFAGALLIPISSRSVNCLVQLVCREQSAVAETVALAAEGDIE
jgi:CRISPR-associated protein Csx17